METLKEIIQRRKLELGQDKKRFNPVHFIADTFFHLKGWDKYPKNHYKNSKKLNYGRYAKEARDLYDYCDHDLDLAISYLYGIASEAKMNKMDWVISTIFKRWKSKQNAKNSSHYNQR